MLFRPHTERRVCGIKIPFTPGLIPKRRYILAEKTGKTITTHLLTDETLVARLCDDGVRSGVEKIIDGFLSEALKSRKTLGSIFFGEGYQDAALISEISQALTGADFRGIAGKLDDLLAGKKTGELIGSELSENIKELISKSIPYISEKLLQIIRSPFFEKYIKPAAIETIEQNVGGLASFFVVPERVYAKFLESAAEYFENSVNYSATEERLLLLYDKLSETDAAFIANITGLDEGRLFSGIAERLEENSEAFKGIADIARDAGEKLLRVIFAMEIGEFLSKISPKYLDGLKTAVMSRYEEAVRNGLPRIMEAIELSDVIKSKIDEFDMSEAEEIILSVVDRELKAITYFGGVLGFVIGLFPAVLQTFGK